MRGQWLSLLQSTPMRLTLALVALFTVVSLASLGVSYVVIREWMEKELRDELLQDIAGYRAAKSATALAALVQARAAVTDPEARILSYVLPNGQAYGNGAIGRSPDGFRVVAFDRPDPDLDGSYIAYTVTLQGGQLTMANSLAPVENLRVIYGRVVLFSLVPTMVIAFGGAYYMARRTRRRIDVIEGTLDKLTRGDLTARVPEMSGRAGDLKSIAARVDRMAKAQEKSMAALKQVSADIAHDLKTPIQRVSVLISQMHETGGLNDDATKLADKAQQETEGIVSTFQALLQIAQIEGGSPKQRFSPVDLADLGSTLAEVYAPAAEESGHALIVDVPDQPVMVHGDKVLLGQVIANLIQNALRHTPMGSEVSVQVARVAGADVLRVSDNGPGIPVDEREKVLQRLYRLETSRTTPGSGLGLSLVSVIADLHDAELTLEDNTPGLSVVLRFPAPTL